MDLGIREILVFTLEFGLKKNIDVLNKTIELYKKFLRDRYTLSRTFFPFLLLLCTKLLRLIRKAMKLKAVTKFLNFHQQSTPLVVLHNLPHQPKMEEPASSAATTSTYAKPVWFATKAAAEPASCEYYMSGESAHSRCTKDVSLRCFSYRQMCWQYQITSSTYIVICVTDNVDFRGWDTPNWVAVVWVPEDDNYGQNKHVSIMVECITHTGIYARCFVC